MRAGPLATLAAVALAVPLAGCALPQPPEPPRRLAEAEVTAFSLSPACVARGEPFLASVTVRNPSDEAGVAEVTVHARQFGNLGTLSVPLGPGESRAAALEGSIGFAGAWQVYPTGAAVRAEQATVRVVDPVAGGRC